MRPCLEVLIVGVFDGDGFDLELDANVFAAAETAGIERLVPAHAEILPVDRRRGDERGALVSHRTGGCTFELDVEHDRLRHAADGQVSVKASQGIVVADRGGRITIVNAMTEELFGYPRDEMLGRTIELLVPEKLAEAHAAHRAGYFSEPRTRPMGLGLDLAGRRKDGSEFPVEISLSHMEGKGGPLAVGFITDITERRKAEEERRNLEKQLRQATKMEAVGRLAGGIAHDFNNLLTTLLGFSEVVLDHVEEGHPLREGAEEVRKTCQRSALLVRQLLAVSRRQLVQPTILDLNNRIKEMETMLRGLIGEDIDLVTDLNPALSPVKADAGQMEQVLLNLVVNARDAMPRGCPGRC